MIVIYYLNSLLCMKFNEVNYYLFCISLNSILIFLLEVNFLIRFWRDGFCIICLIYLVLILICLMFCFKVIIIEGFGCFVKNDFILFVIWWLLSWKRIGFLN